MKKLSALALGVCIVTGLCASNLLRADPSAAVSLESVKTIPPRGVAVPEADRDELEAGVAQLGKDIDFIRDSGAVVEVAPGVASPVLVKAATLLPDVQIFYNAVRYALVYNEFFTPADVQKAKVLLQEGSDRASLLKDGQAQWIHSPGLVVRGYLSKIDGSVQPYGLVIPGSFATDPTRPRRLDIWYHGRGENLSEVNFLSDRRKSVGEFTPNDDTIILHPYGRYCNGNRFAGEIDTFEAMDSVKRNYAIDENRVLVRGFSMGGAACWMFATHHPGLWAAASPGAGFTETAQFLHITDLSTVPWYQQKLWHLYDSKDYAINLFNCPTVAYSGELDAQRQAAEVMEKALAAEGISLAHVIGPKAHHHYVPAAKLEINRRLDSIAARGREVVPNEIRFTTWSLRYNTSRWVRLDRLTHHWEQAKVDAKIDDDDNKLTATTANVEALTLTMPSGYCPFAMNKPVNVSIDGQTVAGVEPVLSDRSWEASFHKAGDKWEAGPAAEEGLHKVHGLQGPIDDAFMDSFIMVHPTGKAFNEKTGAWAAKEEAHAIDHWRKQFRGEARVKDDSAIDNADIASSNLVLWGDPSSNAIIAKIIEKLPIKWDAQAIAIGDKTFPAGSHVPALIFPNPLNPARYVVINSGFTFREYDYENNARQSPKLPDWAIVDVDIPVNAQAPGGIPAAGFFGENWEVLKGK